jgi:Cu-Zn family superoxide dismutase
MRNAVAIALLMMGGLGGLAMGAQPEKPLLPDMGARSVEPPLEGQPPVGAAAELRPTQGNNVSGTLSLTPDKEGVHVVGSIKGLKPNGEHGFHVHEKGDCSAPDASSAGAHFNPGGQPHGNPNAGPHHLGDAPNVRANADGTADVDVHISAATLRTGRADDIFGRAIVVHEKPDDYKSQPAGNSGNRVACGVIK